MNTEKEARERALAFFLNDDNSLKYSKYYFETKLFKEKSASAPCYADITYHFKRKTDKRENILVCAIGFLQNEDNKEYIQPFWNWLTNAKTSPWRNLFKSTFPEKIIVDNQIKGMLFPINILRDESVDWYYICNFLITSRTINEYQEHIAFWWEAVKAGVRRRDAYFLSTFFTYSNGEIYRKDVGNLNHWPLKPYRFSRLGFARSSLNQNPHSMDSVFQGTQTRMDYGWNSLPSTVKQTRFASTSVIKMSDIIKKFDEIKESLV